MWCENLPSICPLHSTFNLHFCDFRSKWHTKHTELRNNKKERPLRWLYNIIYPSSRTHLHRGLFDAHFAQDFQMAKTQSLAKRWLGPAWPGHWRSLQWALKFEYRVFVSGSKLRRLVRLLPIIISWLFLLAADVVAGNCCRFLVCVLLSYLVFFFSFYLFRFGFYFLFLVCPTSASEKKVAQGGPPSTSRWAVIVTLAFWVVRPVLVDIST